MLDWWSEYPSAPALDSLDMTTMKGPSRAALTWPSTESTYEEDLPPQSDRDDKTSDLERTNSRLSLVRPSEPSLHMTSTD